MVERVVGEDECVWDEVGQMVGGFLPMVDELQLLPGNVGWTGGSWDSMEWKLGRLSGEVRPWVRVQSVESTRLETIRDNMLTGQEFVQSGVVSVSRGRLHWTCAAGAPMEGLRVMNTR